MPPARTEAPASQTLVQVGSPGTFTSLLPADWVRVHSSDGSVTFQKPGTHVSLCISKEKPEAGRSRFRTPEDYFSSISGSFPFTKAGSLVVGGLPATRWKRYYEMQHPSPFDDGILRPPYPHNQEIVMIQVEDGFWVLDLDVEAFPFLEPALTASDRGIWEKFLESFALAGAKPAASPKKQEPQERLP